MSLACNTMHESSDKVWLLDSGCSNHMTCNKNLVTNLDQLVKTEVNLGTHKTLDADGKGVVSILTKHGGAKIIWEVYYVPAFKHNLISVGKLMLKEYIVKGKNVLFMKKFQEIIP